MFDAVFAWLEASAWRAWIVESPSLFAFPGILAAHTIGLALLVGVTVALDLRLLGVAPDVPPATIARLRPVMWAGLWLNVATGLALLLAYPTKALTNPVFYLKLTLIAIGLALLRMQLQRLHEGRPVTRVDRQSAALSLAVWAAAIAAGRLLAYTCTRLTVDGPCE